MRNNGKNGYNNLYQNDVTSHLFYLSLIPKTIYYPVWCNVNYFQQYSSFSSLYKLKRLPFYVDGSTPINLRILRLFWVVSLVKIRRLLITYRPTITQRPRSYCKLYLFIRNLNSDSFLRFVTDKVTKV